MSSKIITKNWHHTCYVPLWNVCHPETCFRLAWCTILKNMHFWNMFQTCTVQTSSYRSRIINGRSWSIKIYAKRRKVRSSCICLFVYFSVINVGLLKMQWVKATVSFRWNWSGLPCLMQLFNLLTRVGVP